MIESLHSPHIARVKALISSRGNKERAAHGEFIAEGLQCAREALTAASGPEIKILYATESGLSKIAELNLSSIEIVEVSEAVLKAMSDTVSPQGLISLCYTPESNISDLTLTGHSILIYLHEMRREFFGCQGRWKLAPGKSRPHRPGCSRANLLLPEQLLVSTYLPNQEK